MEIEGIIKEIRQRGLTGYKIAEGTGLTQVGIDKILNGTTKKPTKRTLEILHNYLSKDNTEPITKDDEFTTMVITKLFDSETFKQKLLDYIKENATTIGEEEAIKYEAYLMDFIKQQDKSNKV